MSDYHTGRELVIILVDTVSRGGNLLLDIGPKADGTIPVIMEERLTQIGDWMKINGEAIYGTKPWKATRQWSAGEVPKIEYNKEYSTRLRRDQADGKTGGGQGGNRSFFHHQGQRPVRDSAKLVEQQSLLKDVTGAKSVSLLGSTTPLKFKASKAGVTVTLPDLPEQLRQQPAWVLKISQ